MQRNVPRGRRPANRGPMGRGSGAPGVTISHSLSDRPTTASGPLMTDHLQDLDLELALLKRKREIIEQQQNMLLNKPVYNIPNQYDFDEPRQQYGQPSLEPSNRTRNFSHFYDDVPRTEFGQFDRQQGVKRQVEDNWQDSGAPKRFSALSRGKPKRSGNRPVPIPRPPPLMSEPRRPNTGPKPAPLMSSGPWPYKPRPTSKPRKDFNPAKVTKPKPISAPNKLNSYPEAARKQLIGKASELVAKVPLVLSADQPASRQVMGRLELALGYILKEMKQQYGNDETYVAVFQSLQKQRVLKQAIRDRIRTTMTGKVVGAMTDIVLAYREGHPSDTDSELLKLALDSGPPTTPAKPAVKPIQTESPEKVIRANFNKVLTQRLDEMFAKLKELYATDSDISGTVQETIDNLLAKHQESQKDDKAIGDSEADKTKEKASGEIQDSKEDSTVDATESQEVAQSQETTDKKDEQNESAKTDDKQDETINSSADDNAGNESLTGGHQAHNAKFYTRLIDVLLKRRLPQVLPRYKENILSALRLDEAYKAAKETLKADSKKQNIENRSTEPQTNLTIKTEPATPQKKPIPRVIPYYVKVLGRPGLPKKHLMRAFLDQFHPQIIKKHRSIHNLLFVGFCVKEDFDNILAANQTVIGSSTIDIMVSQLTKDNRGKPQEKLDKSDVEMTQENKPEEEKIIDENLENDITDLLASIRENEENKNEEVDVKKEPTEDAQNGTDAEQEPVEDTTENAGTDVEMKSNATENPEGKTVDETKTEETNEENKDLIEEPNKEETGEVKDDAVETAKNKVVEVKQDAKAPGTPTRSSTRLAASTPRTITTRRTSKLGQN